MVISTDRRLERDGRGAFSQQLAYFCKSRCEKPEGTQKPIPAAECTFTRLQSHRGLDQLAGPIRQRLPPTPLIESGGWRQVTLRLSVSVQLIADDLCQDSERLTDERIDGGIRNIAAAALT